MRNQQLEDKNLVTRVKKRIDKYRLERYTYKEVKDIELIHENDRILVPDRSQQRVLDWYHAMLVNLVQQRMLKSIQSIFHWQGKQKHIEQICVNCRDYQMKN